MKRHLLISVFLCFLSFQISGQDTMLDEAQVEKNLNNGFRINLLSNNRQFGINQEGLFDFNEYTRGLEVAYVKELHKNFNFLIPIGFAINQVVDEANVTNSSEAYLGLDAIGQFLITNRSYKFSPFIFAGIGGEYLPFVNVDNFKGNIPFGVGLDYNLTQKSSIGLRTGYRYGIQSDDYLQIAGGLTHILGGVVNNSKEIEIKLSDLDGDGINDNEDECPGEAGTYAFNGCPDTDGDGVADKDDKCPTIYGEIELEGCAKVDSDNDGVADADDACPDVVGSAATGGCPDTDGDGLADQKDLCPNAFGTIQTNGCPDTDNDGFPDNDDLCPDVVGNVRGCPDSDLDGISDDEDKCPNVAGVAANNGCPAATTTATNSGTIVDQTKLNDVFSRAMTGVQFETASARLKSSSLPILDEIVSLMRQYPEHSLKIGGHTDSIGESGPNQRLSEKRAKACYDYIVKKGINGSRIAYKGYGEKKPIATNKYKDGRKKNRRVEFELFKP